MWHEHVRARRVAAPGRSWYHGDMGQAARRRATYEDLLQVPDTKVAEIIDGELHVSPRPAGPHTYATSGLAGDLVAPFQRGRGGPGGWLIVFEPELHLGEHVLVPDLAGWRKERLPVYPADPWVELAPDWICEALSDSTARIDRIRKMPIYARHGVEWAWLLDPVQQTLEVFRPHEQHWLVVGTFEGAVEVRAEPFDAVPLDLGPLWDRGAAPEPGATE